MQKTQMLHKKAMWFITSAVSYSPVPQSSIYDIITQIHISASSYCTTMTHKVQVPSDFWEAEIV